MSKGHTLLYVIMRGVSERSATGFIVDGVGVHESKQVTYISTHQLGWGGREQANNDIGLRLI